MWKPYFVFPWRPVMIDKRRTWLGEIMRRKLPDGRWEYREFTDEESHDRLAESSF